MSDIEARAERAVAYLAETDKPHAAAKANLNSLHELRKTVKAFEYIEAMKRGSGQGKAEQEAYSSDSYKAHLERIEAAEVEYQTLQNERTSAIQMIEMFRTLSANQRRGNI